MPYRFSHVPVLTEQDNSRNWEEMQTLLNAGLTEGMLGAESVSTAKIAKEAVTEAKLSAAVVAKLNPGAWTSPESFSTKLSETTSLQVRKEQGATSVRLKGTAKANAAIPISTALFTLPAGFRPPAVVRVWAMDASAGLVMLLAITTAGVAESSYAIPNGNIVEFDGITFHLT